MWPIRPEVPSVRLFGTLLQILYLRILHQNKSASITSISTTWRTSSFWRMSSLGKQAFLACICWRWRPVSPSEYDFAAVSFPSFGKLEFFQKVQTRGKSNDICIVRDTEESSTRICFGRQYLQGHLYDNHRPHREKYYLSSVSQRVAWGSRDKDNTHRGTMTEPHTSTTLHPIPRPLERSALPVFSMTSTVSSDTDTGLFSTRTTAIWNKWA
ncbi:hypothetical protein M440DRAFT_1083234 [Trichoderma longibrachiatum ATCC 18648]|uniref:Uncharacterized protein n=1 Tax=Trichoderma longibrachiatum ATCC 18648 TaxID=983965 RepID=A0A2T4BTY1_TRILO|nr:hypothetical protein M440DRAFT_1083234 [Trichoderma longibrachiatum ATCC 18648]